MQATDMKEHIKEFRQPAYTIDSMFVNRWSPRAFQEKDVPEDTLKSILEAARWAPSAMNKQPWRFILARTKNDQELFYTFIMEGNLKWCKKAPVLIAILSEKSTGSHAFDTGTAWGYLALQAAQKGLAAHAMGGFDKEKAREVLNIPDDYAIHAIVALGYQGDKEELPNDLQEREQPSDRKPIEETVFEGTFRI
ncbi:nitroreductase family protein [Aquibacillus sp. 3ASR75-11]|uniref:Nitroreductase family protein n=1 Tax=Terrihalobacillus insolitus TaxID=2950438 RepID=A0A9X3WP51_9BACI|nr:nitroreductase family protein [Terrihalobacillus insolitus]MDC3411967.1 nitroreductase family protein [Terrihalobacillus insolitus]MDC3423347.1 nitroreductase family protein [Terrihalobacillus insolitus]